MNDIDYINFISSDEVQQKLIDKSMDEKDMSLLNRFPEIKIPNKFFSNTGNLIFKDISDSVENNLPSFSNGAVYAPGKRAPVAPPAAPEATARPLPATSFAIYQVKLKAPSYIESAQTAQSAPLAESA